MASVKCPCGATEFDIDLIEEGTDGLGNDGCRCIREARVYHLLTRRWRPRVNA